MIIIFITFLQVLTREKKKIRNAEQNKPQIVVSTNNTTNSLPRQQQPVQQQLQQIPQKPQQQQQQQQTNSGNKPDTGYGQDIKGKRLLFALKIEHLIK